MGTQRLVSLGLPDASDVGLSSRAVDVFACELPCRDGDGDGDCWPVDCDDADAMIHATDGDGDGFTPCEGDRADADPLRHPAAGEVPCGWRLNSTPE